MNIAKQHLKSHPFLTILGAIGLLVIPFVMSRTTYADDSRLISIFVDGNEMSVNSDAATVGEVLQRAQVQVHEHDLVEPAQSEPITSDNFNINVYRGGPVTIIDGEDRYNIISALQSPKSMAEAAGLTVYPEDRFTTERVNNFIDEANVGLKVIIDRATPLTLNLYGTPVTVRTHAATVGDLLKEKELNLGENDVLTPAPETAITEGMTISLVRTGKEVVSAEEEVPFPEEIVQDSGRPLGERIIQSAGSNGRRLATYEVTYHNGVEVARVEINAVTIAEPTKQVVIVGTKAAGGAGGVWAALRACEAGGVYSRNSGNGYYGAYQFSFTTWKSVAPDPYKNTLPSEAPPHIQDQAAQTLQARSGWGQWPACARKLGLY